MDPRPPSRRPSEPPPDPRSFFVPAPDGAAGADPVPAREPSSGPAQGAPKPAESPVSPAAAPRRRSGRRHWATRVALGALGALALLSLVWLTVSWQTYRTIPRVDVGNALSPKTRGGTNLLIVGTDSREGVAEENPNADVIGGEIGSTRTDTIVVLHRGPSGDVLLPIPRDLYVPIAGTNGRDRINTAIQGGPERLVRTVQQSLGIPVHHYVEVDFAGFMSLVDAVGGVTIDFDAPAFDDHSGLNVTEAGSVRLDRDQALAYVRSRRYTRIVDGRRIEDPRADLGRIERQQIFLRAVMRQVGEVRNPITLLRIERGVAKGLRLDDRLGFGDAIGLARALRGLDPETLGLPVRNLTTPGGAAVLELVRAEAEPVLARVRD